VLENSAASSREQFQGALLELRLAATGSEQDQKIQVAAWQRIEKLAQGKDAAGLDALVLLAQRALSGGRTAASSPVQNTDATADVLPGRIAETIEQHPLAKAPHQLLAVDLRIQSLPNEKERLIQSAIERWKNAGNESLAALAAWLNGKGEFQRELDTIALARALQTRDLFLQRLDALGALGQWAEVKRLLTSEAFPLEPMIERMYLARCSQQLNEIIAAQNNWQRAFEAAEGEPQKLLTLADYAEKNGATKTAGQAYDAIVREAPSIRAGQQGRLRLAQQSRDTRRIHQVLLEMLKQWPNDTAIQNDEAYLRLLLAGTKDEVTRQREEVAGATTAVPSKSVGEKRAGASNSSQISAVSSQLSEISVLAENLVAREPASLPHRTLLALARLRAGEPAKALEVYKNIQVPPNAVSPSAIAVHAAVLAANGQIADARTEAGALKQDQLLPEERDLLQKLP